MNDVNNIGTWYLRHHTHPHMPVKEIAKELHRSERQIRYALDAAGNDFPPAKRQRLGRKRKIEDIPKLDKKLKEHYRETTKKAAESLTEAFKVKISAATLWRYRIDLQVYKTRSRQRYFLRNSDLKSRVEYCKKYINDPLEDVWFSDAVWIGVSKEGHVIWWSVRWGSPPTEVLYTIKPIFLWAAVSVKGMTDLIPISGRINHKEYLELLKNVYPTFDDLYPDGFRFITDCWKVAIAKRNRPYLREKLGWIDGYPIKSGDLNLMEYIWSWLKRLLEQRKIRDQDELLAAANDIWADLSPKMICAFLEHLKEYMTAVINHDGHYVNESFQRTLKRRKCIYTPDRSK